MGWLQPAAACEREPFVPCCQLLHQQHTYRERLLADSGLRLRWLWELMPTLESANKQGIFLRSTHTQGQSQQATNLIVELQSSLTQGDIRGASCVG